MSGKQNLVCEGCGKIFPVDKGDTTAHQAAVSALVEHVMTHVAKDDGKAMKATTDEIAKDLFGSGAGSNN